MTNEAGATKNIPQFFLQPFLLLRSLLSALFSLLFPMPHHPKTQAAKRPWDFSISSDGSIMTNVDGETLFRKEWRLKQGVAPIGFLYIVHGAGEHCLRYDHVARKFNEHGMFVVAHDHVGHGQSTGKRVSIDDFQIYVRDVISDITHTLRQLPQDIPVFLYGHSMGGTISSHVILQRPDLFKGCILSAPAIVPDPATAKPHLVFIARHLARHFPELGLDKLDRKWMSRNAEARADMKKDPLNFKGKMKAGWAMQMLDAMNHVVANAKEIKLPLLVQQGGDDHVCNAEGARVLEKNASSTDLTVKFYDGMYHDLMHELPDDTATVIFDLLDWVLARIPGATRPTPPPAPAPAPAATPAATPAAPVEAGATAAAASAPAPAAAENGAAAHAGENGEAAKESAHAVDASGAAPAVAVEGGDASVSDV